MTGNHVAAQRHDGETLHSGRGRADQFHTTVGCMSGVEMGKHRTPYSAEFRAQLVELVKAGRSPKELAREFEPTAQTILNWVAQADRDAGVRQDGLTTAERQELTRLRRMSCATRRP